MPSPHTEATDATIARLAASGMSASQIAVELGAPFTRNSVIGRAHRTGIALSKLVVSTEPKRRQPNPAGNPVRVNKPVTLAPSAGFVPTFVAVPKPAPEPVAPPDPTSHAVNLFGLTSKTCRNPLGPKMERAVLFCGKQVKAGSVYCAHCHSINYSPRLPPTRATVDKRVSKFGGYLMAAAE